MPELKLLLVTGRSLKQGTGLNMGKHSSEYLQEVGTVELSAGDMARLNVRDGDEVQLVSSQGQATALCRKADLPEGMGFIAYGPASSLLMGTETEATGMPGSKHLEVQVRASAEGRAYAG